MKTPLPLIVCLLSITPGAQGSVIDVDYRQPEKPLATFWNSTGFSPADIVLTKEMKQVLHDTGQLPKRGIKYIRPHYLLNLAEARAMGTANPVYDWAGLDEVLDEFARNHLKLIFELMGFPSDGTDRSENRYDENFQEQLVRRKTYFDNFQSREQLANWKSFVTALALHLERRYGAEEVRTWFFETTNEPDLPKFWRYDVPTFLNYYDACSEGLRKADPSLQFGGPGTASRPDLARLFKLLMAHCDTGRNYFTGETGVRLDFISFHIKDLPQNVITRELRVVDYLRALHPRLAARPLINDESDPISGWATPYWWERGPWYAAFIAQNIDLHQRLLIERAGVNYRLFSSDNAFMGGWNQRTTHALFRAQPNREGFVAITKPVQTVMELIAQLGPRYVDVSIPNEVSPYFGVIPTRDHGTLAILVYNKTAIGIGRDPKPEPDDLETALMEQQRVRTRLRIRGIKGATGSVKEFRIDETHGNPYHEWAKMGKPRVLSEDQVARLRKAEQPALIRSERISCPDGLYDYPIEAPSPSVSLIQIEPDP